MRNYEAEMSPEDLQAAKEIISRLGLETVTVNEFYNDIAEIIGRQCTKITFEEKETIANERA